MPIIKRPKEDDVHKIGKFGDYFFANGKDDWFPVNFSVEFLLVLIKNS